MHIFSYFWHLPTSQGPRKAKVNLLTPARVSVPFIKTSELPGCRVARDLSGAKSPSGDFSLGEGEREVANWKWLNYLKNTWKNTWKWLKNNSILFVLSKHKRTHGPFKWILVHELGERKAPVVHRDCCMGFEVTWTCLNMRHSSLN